MSTDRLSSCQTLVGGCNMVEYSDLSAARSRAAEIQAQLEACREGWRVGLFQSRCLRLAP